MKDGEICKWEGQELGQWTLTLGISGSEGGKK